MLLVLCSGAAAQEDECYFPGQSYTFSTICNESWEYLWTATEGTFDGNITSDKCTVNWTAPMVSSKTNVTLYVTVANNVTVGALVESCVDMDDFNITVCPLSNITVRKFYDINGNGNWDPDEPPLDNWEMTLYNSSGCTGAPIAVNSTVDGGYRNFTGLLPGEYSVKETLKPGWEVTYPDTVCQNLTLASGQNVQIYFGNRGNLSISGVKFYDPEDTGDKTGKVRLGGWNITLSIWDVDTSGWVELNKTITSSDPGSLGQYAFDGLVPGRYRVCETVKDGWEQTWPDTADRCYEVDMSGKNPASKIDADFGNRGNLVIDPCKFNDLDGDGEKGDFEPTIPFWPVNLTGPYDYSFDGDTGELGCIAFIYLPPGEYTASEGIIAGWVNTTPTSETFALDTTNSPYNVSFGNRGDLDIDPCKFNDLNGNGIRDTDEPGIPGWKITVTGPAGYEKTLPTGEGGCVFFENLIPGDYTVTEETRDGWTNTTPTSETITLDSENSPKVILFGNQQPVDFEVRKIALNKSVNRGGEVEYLIQIKTDFTELNNVTVKDVFNRKVEFISASPMPDADGIWRFAKVIVGNLPVDENDTAWRTLIVLKIKVPEKQDFDFDMEQGVAGHGFVNVKNDYSTTYQAYLITNCIYVTLDEFPGKTFSDCESVTVMLDSGTELKTREHGSGTYDSEELVTVKTENKSILMQKDMAATYSPTTLGLYHGREVAFSSRWTQEANAKNRVTGASMSEQYRYATRIDRESRMLLDQNESVMEIDSEFEGMGHIGFLKMPSAPSTPQTKPIIEIREDYVGSFKILQNVDEYGKGVSYEKGATGSGFTVGDRRIGESQRSYESGTGTYDSEEIIETSTNYIAKDISLAYAPMSHQLTDSRTIALSQKWKEGMYSVNPRTSYIGEEYTSLDYLDKDTTARGLNEMLTDASFEGRARYRVLLENNLGEPQIDFDDQYDGDYSIQRRVHLTGISKYDQPHLNVTKTLNRVYEETLPWGYGEPHLEGAVKKRKVADYTIRIENDGNRVLQPVYIQDRFPPGAIFIEPSSLRPTEITDSYANWTLTHLSIGAAVEIHLLLDVSKYYPTGYQPDMVNRVEVCGVYDDEQVCASNFTALEIKWLNIGLGDPVSVAKTGEIDTENPRVVRYSIDVTNHDDATRVATVTDRLPAGMKLLESAVPFASYKSGVVVWNILEIGPGETVTIEFSALAPGDGRFTNIVEVDPRSIDGPVAQPVYATCVIDVGIVEGECGPAGCGTWQPPNWELQNVGYGPDTTTCEQLTCTSCDGTGNCPAP